MSKESAIREQINWLPAGVDVYTDGSVYAIVYPVNIAGPHLVTVHTIQVIAGDTTVHVIAEPDWKHSNNPYIVELRERAVKME